MRLLNLLEVWLDICSPSLCFYATLAVTGIFFINLSQSSRGSSFAIVRLLNVGSLSSLQRHFKMRFFCVRVH